jgi:hypothetical protein
MSKSGLFRHFGSKLDLQLARHGHHYLDYLYSFPGGLPIETATIVVTKPDRRQPKGLLEVGCRWGRETAQLAPGRPLFVL